MSLATDARAYAACRWPKTNIPCRNVERPRCPESSIIDHAIARLTDPANYLSAAPEMVDRDHGFSDALNARPRASWGFSCRPATRQPAPNNNYEPGVVVLKFGCVFADRDCSGTGPRVLESHSA